MSNRDESGNRRVYIQCHSKILPNQESRVQDFMQNVQIYPSGTAIPVRGILANCDNSCQYEATCMHVCMHIYPAVGVLGVLEAKTILAVCMLEQQISMHAISALYTYLLECMTRSLIDKNG